MILTAASVRSRAAVVPAERMIDFPPHVTIVHPRTSDRGQQAWEELAGTHLDARFTITHVAVTAFSGGRWLTLRLLPLRSSRGTGTDGSSRLHPGATGRTQAPQVSGTALPYHRWDRTGDTPVRGV
jgi:hypothetical protein